MACCIQLVEPRRWLGRRGMMEQLPIFGRAESFYMCCAACWFLPFRDDHLVSMYRKIYQGDFKCPPWFSSDARRLLTKLLDPNPYTRITSPKIMESSWFKKSVPEYVYAELELELNNDFSSKGKESDKLNSFHIISLSQGFDLSPIFEEKMREERKDIRFATSRPASSVISRLDEVAKAGKFSFNTSDTIVRLQGQERGRLAIEAEIFSVGPSFLVVEMKKVGGDTLEYCQFCSKELRPALKDILWTSPADNSVPA